MALQGDGKIISAQAWDEVQKRSVALIVRLLADGSPDSSFSRVTLNWDGSPDLALQADGRILAWRCFTSVNGVPYNGLARLNSDGTLDAAFPHSLKPGFPPMPVWTPCGWKPRPELSSWNPGLGDRMGSVVRRMALSGRV
ncbi:MAG: hypothetical protein FJ403_21385 [Verrucomicrobia bacterium]|nr:hypothetical protein [Verrucomicrobiota bacterium]